LSNNNELFFFETGMNTLITVLHVLAAFSLILTVLLQAGKGAAMGSGLGGGSSQTMFGSSGAGNFLTKLTTGIAILFMVTSLTLATFSNNTKSKSVIEGVEESLPAATTESKDSTDKSSN
jgi:preprotein translocase subunit SecG